MIAMRKNTKITKVLLLIIIHIITWLLPFTTLSENYLTDDEEKIKKALQHIQQSNYNDINQQTIIHTLQSALHFISEKKISNSKIKEYQQIIDNFSYITLQLREEYNNICDQSINIFQYISEHELKQKIYHINNQLINLSKQLQQEQDHARSIEQSLLLLPQQQIEAKNTLRNLEQQQILPINITITPLEHAQLTALQAEQTAKKLKIAELEFAQLSASNRKELSRLRIALLKKKYNYTHNELKILRNQLNQLYQQKTHYDIKFTEKTFSEPNNNTLPKCIKNQFQINRNLSVILTQQSNYINDIESQKNQTTLHILQVHQAFANLTEQAQWIHKSPILGEILRSQISKLPKIPKSQQLDNEMAKLRAKRLQYEEQINKLTILFSKSKQDNGSSLTPTQQNILKKQISIQRNLITSLLNNYDTQIIELTKLKITYEQLKQALQEITKATHRHLFWIADNQPITISYPFEIYRDLNKLFTQNTFFYYILSKLNIIYIYKKALILITLIIIILVKCYLKAYDHYQIFLTQSSKLIGKVNQDNFLLTIHNIWSSMLIALPIPILWGIIGYNLRHFCWLYPIAISISDSINATVFILWIFLINNYFASSKGLFIIHFGWSKKRVHKVFSHYYIWSIIAMITLITALIVFNNYNDQEFYNTLGRLCFIILCVYLSCITKNLKDSGLPLFLNKYDSSDNIINRSLWNIMLCAPIIAAIACSLGYSFVAQTLLTKLETSLLIWIILLIIYHIILRWISIQRRRIAFKRTKQKQVSQLTSKIYNESNTSQLSLTSISNNTKDKKFFDLDTISTQSLQLIRSIITLIALLIMTLIWSELRSAFSFLENITLWDVTSTIKGVDNIQPITLNSFLIAILVIIITTKTVRNLPAFLELILLQHLNFTPGTKHAITTLTKYILMLLGSLTGFSLIGIEWSKIQWLIAALGVGLGFGLQEIFANLISGLIILFEKPIRIGDTITICNLTGNVTRINTRATIITDWDHKEIIVPNKEFITKQFINWSLSDTITRVVLRVPAPLKTDLKKTVEVLLKIIKNSSLVLKTPNPEVFLIDLQQGLPIFEIRLYTAHTKSRVPVCHQVHMLIMEYYNKNGLELPHIPFYLYRDHSIITEKFYPNFTQNPIK